MVNWLRIEDVGDVPTRVWYETCRIEKLSIALFHEVSAEFSFMLYA